MMLLPRCLPHYLNYRKWRCLLTHLDMLADIFSCCRSISLKEKLDYLSNAEMCARVVTSPTKLLDMRYLMDNINTDKELVMTQLKTTVQ